LALGAVLAGLSSLVGAAPPAGAAGSTITHSGRWLVDPQGRVVVVHGTNVVNKLAPYTPQAIGFGADDADFLAANGFTVVRLGIIWAGVEPQPGAYDDGYIAQIRQTQQLLGSRGIYTLLDWHQDLMNEMFGGEGFPTWAVDTGGLAPESPLRPFPDEYDDPASQAAWDNFLANRPGPGGVGLQDRLAAAQRHVATSFVGDPWLLGYDVMNEPNEGSGTPPFSDPTVGAMQQRLLSAIRTVDRDHMVFYEPNMLYGISGELLPRFNDPNAGMSYHSYCYEPPTGLPEFIYQLTCGGVLNGAQANANDHSARTGNANILTEFGSAQPYVLRMVAGYADTNMTSWAQWNYCGCGDPTTTIDPDKEGIVINPRTAPSGANVNARSLAALTRPYPHRIAGTPTSWSFDTATKTFRAAWSTSPPAGATPTPGATTTIVLPRSAYPNGYTTTVTGGRVVGGDGTGLISVAATSGQASVTVVINPR
jgi:endoglycosylceramidase